MSSAIVVHPGYGSGYELIGHRQVDYIAGLGHTHALQIKYQARASDCGLIGIAEFELYHGSVDAGSAEHAIHAIY